MLASVACDAEKKRGPDRKTLVLNLGAVALAAIAASLIAVCFFSNTAGMRRRMEECGGVLSDCEKDNKKPDGLLAQVEGKKNEWKLIDMKESLDGKTMKVCPLKASKSKVPDAITCYLKSRERKTRDAINRYLLPVQDLHVDIIVYGSDVTWVENFDPEKLDCVDRYNKPFIFPGLEKEEEFALRMFISDLVRRYDQWQDATAEDSGVNEDDEGEDHGRAG